MRYLAVVALYLVLFGCADTKEHFDAGADQGQLADGEVDQGWPDALKVETSLPDGFTLGKEVVYAQTEDTLYKVDPETLAITEVGAFAFPPNTTSPKMTDIALDKDGRMIGVTSEAVYEVDPKTAECTFLAASAGHYVGLSYVWDNTAIDGKEYLMGMAKTGEIYEIDPGTGQATQRGTLGYDPVVTDEPLIAAGDIVSIKGLGTFATVVRPGYDNDWLAQLDPGTGEATLIRDTGYQKIWGLGFWKQGGENKVFGFNTEGKFLLIDLRFGGTTTVVSENATQVWWGAGVTTEAPAIL